MTTLSDASRYPPQRQLGASQSQIHDLDQIAGPLPGPNPLCAGQNVGVKQVEEKIWLVSFMQYDLGYFDDETCRIESADNPFAAKLSPMSPV